MCMCTRVFVCPYTAVSVRRHQCHSQQGRGTRRTPMTLAAVWHRTVTRRRVTVCFTESFCFCVDPVFCSCVFHRVCACYWSPCTGVVTCDVFHVLIKVLTVSVTISPPCSEFRLYAPRHQSEGIKQSCCRSVCLSHDCSSKQYISELWLGLLYMSSTDRKTHVRSLTHQKWPKRH